MSGCLLDTNALIWVLTGKERLSRRAVSRIERQRSSLVVSLVSVWEIVVKYQKGRLWTNREFASFLNVVREQANWRLLEISTGHLLTLAALPLLDDHKDPFDRLLIAQAIHEGFEIVTADPHFARYKVPVVW